MQSKKLSYVVLSAIVFGTTVANANTQQCFDFLNSSSRNMPYRNNGRPNILDSMNKAESDKLTLAQAKENIDPSAPVLLTQKAKAFRDRYLPFFKDPIKREALIQQFESEMRLRSFKTTEELAKRAENFYDLVLIGSGPQGVVFLNRFLELNPKARVLVVDRADTAGATFRYLGTSLTINSSNRASGLDRLPLPGNGNINELPGLPIQVSEMTGVKYPTGADLSSAIIAGFYENVRNNPRVDVVFRTEALEELTEATKENPDYSTGAVLKLSNGTKTTVRSIVTVTGPGLGIDRLPEKLKQNLVNDPSLVEPQAGKKIARVETVGDALRNINQGKAMLDELKGKTILLAGDGDYAYVYLESLLGYMVSAGYGNSTAQTIGPAKVLWLNQSAKDCKEFIAKIRSRYQAIGTGFRSSNPNLEALIQPFDSKLDSVVAEGEGKVLGTLVDGKKLIGDHAVLATGFEGQVRTLFRDGKNFVDDKSFYETAWNFITERTRTSADMLTRVGIALKSNPNSFLLGPAVRLPTKEDLLGVIQNFVSIFNNAPRSVGLAEAVSRAFQTTKKRMGSNKATPVATFGRIEISDKDQGAVRITNLAEKRAVGNLSATLLTSIFKTTLQSLKFVETTSHQSKVDFTIALGSDRQSVVLDSNGSVDLVRLANVLASTRDFFNLSREFLLASPEGKLVFSVPVNKTGFVADETTFTINKSVRVRRAETSVPNAALENSLKNAIKKEQTKPSGGDAKAAPVATSAATTADIAPTFKRGDMVYYGIREFLFDSFDNDGRALLVSVATGDEIPAPGDSIAAKNGRFGGIAVGDVVSFGSMSVTVRGISKDGSFVVESALQKFLVNRPQLGPEKPIEAAKPATNPQSGVLPDERPVLKENEIVYYGGRKYKITQLDDSTNTAVLKSIYDGDLIKVPTSPIAAPNGRFKGIGIGDLVYINLVPAVVRGLTLDGKFTVETNSSQIITAVTRQTLSATTGTSPNGYRPGDVVISQEESSGMRSKVLAYGENGTLLISSLRTGVLRVVEPIEIFLFDRPD